MANVATVYLNASVAPTGKDWHKGYIENHSALGVWVNSRDDGRGDRTFYPAHQIQRIAYNSGW